MLSNLIQTLQLPDACIVKKNLTKAFFKRNFELTLSERKLLDDSTIFNSMDIVASIKTANSNIPTFSDEQMQYIEVLVLAVQTSETDFDKNNQKIAELIQKYIPYPLLICIYSNTQFILNTCDKRINRTEPSKRTVEKQYYTENIALNTTVEKQKTFLNSLAFAQLEKQNLKSLFDNYTACIIALQTAEISGSFRVRRNEQSKEDVLNLEMIAQLQSEIVTLQNQAKKETQLSAQISLNTIIQQKRKQIQNLENSFIA